MASDKSETARWTLRGVGASGIAQGTPVIVATGPWPTAPVEVVAVDTLLSDEYVDMVYRRLNGLGTETSKDQIKAVLHCATGDASTGQRVCKGTAKPPETSYGVTGTHVQADVRDGISPRENN